MDRRKFLGFAALGGIVMPLAARAQNAGRIPRIALLSVPTLEAPEMQPLLEAFRQGLREHGYVEGKTIVIEYRSADGKLDQLPRVVNEVAAPNVDVIFVGTTLVARAMRQATRTTPIVAGAMTDPIEDGLARSLARLAGNVTGLTFIGGELVVKRFELLKQALPHAYRVAGLWQGGPGEHSTKEMLREAKVASRTMGLELHLTGVQTADELDGAFSTIASTRPDALVVFPNSGVFFIERLRIVDLAAKHQLPSIHYAIEFAAIGGLISYRPSSLDLIRRSASYIDRILKGAKPGDLPIEQPTKFELVVNLKTAKALGLTIPQSLFVRADEVIQ